MKLSLRLYVALAFLNAMVQGQNGTDTNSTAPSFFPTFAPSSSFPSLSPSLVPSELVTSSEPSSLPSLEPSITSSGAPSEGPSGTPTVAPSTDSPTTATPTTATPTAVNTTEPTSSPTTSSPSIAPTPSATDPETFSPTSSPTSFPSLAPVTAAPSSGPSAQPSGGTFSPTLLPSEMPSATPSEPTTSSPTSGTSSPTGTPPPPPDVSETLEGLQLTLVGVGVLDAAAQLVFLTETRNFYLDVYADRRRRHLRSLQAVEGITNFDTILRNLRQSVTDDGNTVTYTQLVEYSTTDGANAEDVVAGPLQDDALLADYVSLLQNSGNEAFDTLTAVDTTPTPPDDGDDDDDGLSGGAIGGIIAGGAVLLIGGGYLLMRANGGDGHSRLDERDNLPPSSFSAVQSEEVSTMDQPVARTGTGESGLLDMGDQSVATVDYDYSKAYGGADTSVVSSAGGTMGENTRETGSALQTSARAALGASFDSEGKADVNVREEVIEINAPAGKLGVVIDTPDEGAPVVHAVKDSSVIADLIQVGDKLVAVDDEDVTAMTAIKVSKLISKKSANPSRKLTVIRQVVIEE